MHEPTPQEDLNRLAEQDVPAAEIDLWPEIRAQALARGSQANAGMTPKPRRTTPTLRPFAGLFRSLSWTAAGLALVLFVGWAIGNTRPLAGQPDLTPTPLPTATATPVGETGLEPGLPETLSPTDLPPDGQMPTLPPPTALPEQPIQPRPPVVFTGDQFTSPFFPEVNFTLATAWPASPATANLYRYLPSEALTVESARAMAERLGVQGEVYQSHPESGEVGYIVSDGGGRVIFIGSPWRFSYLIGQEFNLALAGDLPPYDQQVAAAEAFLNTRGLLDFPYTVEPLDRYRGVLRFIARLDGLPVRNLNLEAPEIEVKISGQGQVSQVSYTRADLESLGAYPILTAEEAWQQALGKDLRGLASAWHMGPPYTMRAWPRPRPVDLDVDLYGHAYAMDAAEPGVAPLLFFENIPVQGDPEVLRAEAWIEVTRPGSFLHVWGQIRVDDQGKKVLHLAGWEPAPVTVAQFDGQVERRGNEAYLVAAGQPELFLPDLPPSVPEGEPVAMVGLLLPGTQTLEWVMLHAGSSGGWVMPGLSGFAALNLNGLAEAQPTAAPLAGTDAPGADAQAGVELPEIDTPGVAMSPGNVMVENIELVYIAPDLRSGFPADPANWYVQPVWRFTGRYANGDQFEILVQALLRDYLGL